MAPPRQWGAAPVTVMSLAAIVLKVDTEHPHAPATMVAVQRPTAAECVPQRSASTPPSRPHTTKPKESQVNPAAKR